MILKFEVQTGIELVDFYIVTCIGLVMFYINSRISSTELIIFNERGMPCHAMSSDMQLAA